MVSVRDAPLLGSLQKAPNGHFEFSSLVDHQRRIYAYEHLSGLPLVVTVGFSTAALDGARMRDASSASMVLLLVATILVLTNTLALRQYAAARAREVTWQVRQAELEALLTDLAPTHRAQHLARAMAQEHGAEVAADALERLCSSPAATTPGGAGGA